MPPLPPGELYFSANTSTGDGGGIHAASSAYISGIGRAVGLLVTSNGAGGSGGGIYATGTLTIVDLKNAEVVSNSGSGGGGIAAWNGARVTLDWGHSKIFIHHRGAEDIAAARVVDPRVQVPEADGARVLDPAWLSAHQ